MFCPNRISACTFVLSIDIEDGREVGPHLFMMLKLFIERVIRAHRDTFAYDRNS